MPARDIDYLNDPLKEYLDKLAEKQPVPGGGSAVALVASVSSALISMVLNYTIGKDKYLEIEPKLQNIKSENDRIYKELSEFIEEDSRVYKSIVSHTKKNPVLAEELLKKSALIHLEICEKAMKLVEFSDFLSRNGNKNLISDAAISSEFALSAFKTALINILINDRYISDRTFSSKILTEATDIEEKIKKKNDSVYMYVKNYLREG